MNLEENNKNDLLFLECLSYCFQLYIEAQSVKQNV